MIINENSLSKIDALLEDAASVASLNRGLVNTRLKDIKRGLGSPKMNQPLSVHKARAHMMNSATKKVANESNAGMPVIYGK